MTILSWWGSHQIVYHAHDNDSQQKHKRLALSNRVKMEVSEHPIHLDVKMVHFDVKMDLSAELQPNPC